MNFTQIEEALIKRVQDYFGNTLKMVDSIPVDFSKDEFKRMVASAPGIYISFAFGSRNPNSGGASMIGRWAFTCVSANAGGEKQRRHGSKVNIGAYHMMFRIIPLMHNFTVDGVGTMDFLDAQNLFTEDLDAEGVSAYAAIFTLPMTLDAATLNPNGLNDFVTFKSDIDLAPTDSRPEIQTSVTLEQ